MSTMVRVLTAMLLASVLIASSALADNKSDAKARDIKALVTKLGLATAADNTVDQLINVLKPQMPRASDAFWKEFRSEVRSEEFVEILITTYDKHFTHDEIKELLRFFETSAVGKKFAHELPIISSEIAQGSSRWAIKLVVQARKKFEAQQDK